MIGIFLICFCVFPLVRLPTRALNEETKTAYRVQLHRFADLACAKVKEMLYRQEISWKDISRTSKEAAIPIDDTITIPLEPLGARKFRRKVLLHSVGKKDQDGEEWRLVTVKVKFRPLSFNKGESKTPRTFTYQVLVNQKSNPAAQPPKLN